MKINVDLKALALEKGIEAQKEDLSPEALYKRGMKAGGVVGVKAEALMREYPPAPNGRAMPLRYVRRNAKGELYRSKWKNLKQQRLVIMLAKQGKIPYRRTGQLGRTIGHKVVISEQGTDIVIQFGSNAPHAPWVIGKDQAWYHQITGWKTIPNVLAANQADLTASFKKAY